MAETYSSKVAFASTPEQVSKLLHLDETTPEPWEPKDLRAMVRHQLSAPCEFDLSAVHASKPQGKAHNKTPTEAANGGVRSFEDILFHPHPPLDLLRLSKEFFKKRVQDCKKTTPEGRVAYLFYLLSILMAGVEAPNVSALKKEDLGKGIRWALDQDWVDDRIKQRISWARQRL